GHYDSRNSDTLNTKDPAPGANDDASGTAVSLECARVLSKYKFPATLIFLSVAGEEQGLDGAKHFAEMARQQGWEIQGVLNNDIVRGNTTPGDSGQRKDTVRVFSEGIPASAKPEDITRIRNLGGENDSRSRELARYIRKTAKQYLPQFQPTLIFRRDRFLRGGDHTAFNEEGFAGVRFTEYREDFHHQHQNVRIENGIEYGDLLKFVDFGYVANVARVNAATLASLALAPAPPANVRIDTRLCAWARSGSVRGGHTSTREGPAWIVVATGHIPIHVCRSHCLPLISRWHLFHRQPSREPDWLAAVLWTLLRQPHRSGCCRR